MSEHGQQGIDPFRLSSFLHLFSIFYENGVSIFPISKPLGISTMGVMQLVVQKVFITIFTFSENSGTLKDKLNIHLFSGKILRIPFIQYWKRIWSGLDRVFLLLQKFFIKSINGIILKRVLQISNWHQIIHCHQIKFWILQKLFTSCSPGPS